jgi:hypothetical protein
MMSWPSSTRRSEGPRTQDLFPYTGPKSSRQWLFYFPFGKSAPTTNFKKFPLVLREIGLRTFTNPVVKRLVSQSPKTRKQSTLTLSLLFQISPYRDFGGRDVKQLVPSIPETRFAETLMHSQALTFQRLSLHRDFGLRDIANPNAKNSELHPTKPRNGQRNLTPCR